MKTCSRCGSEFDANRKHAWCKPCAAAYLREFRKKNPGYDKREGRLYTKCSGCGVEIPPSTGHRCDECNNKQQKLLRAKIPDRIREVDRQRYERDKEKRLAYWQSTRPQQAARQRERYQANPEYYKAKEHNYRTRKKGNGGVVTASELRALVESCGGRCAHCGIVTSGRNQTIDHIHPVVLGGSSSIDNLQVLCRSCNSRKGARLEGGGSHQAPDMCGCG